MPLVGEGGITLLEDAGYPRIRGSSAKNHAAVHVIVLFCSMRVGHAVRGEYFGQHSMAWACGGTGDERECKLVIGIVDSQERSPISQSPLTRTTGVTVRSSLEIPGSDCHCAG